MGGSGRDGEGREAAAGWYPDPQGRFESRYWNGTAWTNHILHRGTPGTDAPGAGAAPGAPGVVTVAAAANLGGVPGPRPAHHGRVRQENRAGIGTVLVLAGLALYAFSLGQPWIGGTDAMTKPPGLAAAASQDWGSFGEALGMGAIVLVLTVLFTTLRYQPGGVAGLFYGGIIGCILLRNKPDRDSPTRRSNYLALFVLPLSLIVIWATASSISNEEGYGSLGSGPKVATVGFLLALVGAFVGRRRITIQD